jgi:hypothetical protein
MLHGTKIIAIDFSSLQSYSSLPIKQALQSSSIGAILHSSLLHLSLTYQHG